MTMITKQRSNMAARLKLLLRWPGLHDLGKAWILDNYLTIIGLVALKLKTYYLLYAKAEIYVCQS